MDYIWTYENLAENDGLRFVKLPDAIDLGAPADSAEYARVSTTVVGKRPGETLTMRGAPILFALAVAANAKNRAAAERFVAFVLSAEGRRIMRAEHLDALERAAFVGSGIPAHLR